jgi:hypothetical protein
MDNFLAAGFYLLFSIGNGPVEMSARVFDTVDECANLVNEIAGGSVVDEFNLFEFMSSDGDVILGGCYSKEEIDTIMKPIDREV